LWMWYWTFGFHKMLGNCQMASQLVASRVVHSCIELNSYIQFPTASRRYAKITEISCTSLSLKQPEFVISIYFIKILSALPKHHIVYHNIHGQIYTKTNAAVVSTIYRKWEIEQIKFLFFFFFLQFESAIRIYIL
jgi:hypothetical protein